MRGDSFAITAYRRLCDQQTLHDARPQEQRLSVACDVSCRAGRQSRKAKDNQRVCTKVIGNNLLNACGLAYNWRQSAKVHFVCTSTRESTSS